MSNEELTKIREDYLRGFSTRMLAVKYNVPKSTIARWVKRFGWVPEVKRRREEINAELLPDEKSEEVLPEPEVIPEPEPDPEPEPERGAESGADAPQKPGATGQHVKLERLPADPDYLKMRRYVNKLYEKVDQLLELDDALAPRDLKSLSSMLLDVRQLLNILSPREAAEQEMRLVALRKQCDDKKTEDRSIEVVFVGDTEEAAR